MKKLIVLPLFIILILTGCSSEKKTESVDSTSSAESTETNNKSSGFTAAVEFNSSKLKNEVLAEKSVLNNKSLASEMSKRYKECEKGRVIKRPGSFNMDLDGLNIFVKEQQIASVGKLNLSSNTLAAITEKFAIIDNVLYSCCVDLAKEYDQNPRNIEIVKFILDKKYAYLGKMADIATELKKAESNRLSEPQIKTKIDSVNIK